MSTGALSGFSRSANGGVRPFPKLAEVVWPGAGGRAFCARAGGARGPVGRLRPPAAAAACDAARLPGCGEGGDGRAWVSARYRCRRLQGRSGCGAGARGPAGSAREAAAAAVQRGSPRAAQACAFGSAREPALRPDSGRLRWCAARSPRPGRAADRPGPRRVCSDTGCEGVSPRRCESGCSRDDSRLFGSGCCRTRAGRVGGGGRALDPTACHVPFYVVILFLVFSVALAALRFTLW